MDDRQQSFHGASQAELRRSVMLSVHMTGEPAILPPLSHVAVGELEEVINDAYAYGLRLAGVPKGGLTVLPSIPIRDDDLLHFSFQYCTAVDSEARAAVRRDIYLFPYDSYGTVVGRDRLPEPTRGRDSAPTPQTDGIGIQVKVEAAADTTGLVEGSSSSSCVEPPRRKVSTLTLRRAFPSVPQGEGGQLGPQRVQPASAEATECSVSGSSSSSVADVASTASPNSVMTSHDEENEEVARASDLRPGSQEASNCHVAGETAAAGIPSVPMRLSNGPGQPTDHSSVCFTPRGPSGPVQRLYHPADIVARIVHLLYEVLWLGDTELRAIMEYSPLLHISPVKDICHQLRTRAHAEAWVPSVLPFRTWLPYDGSNAWLRPPQDTPVAPYGISPYAFRAGAFTASWSQLPHAAPVGRMLPPPYSPYPTGPQRWPYGGQPGTLVGAHSAHPLSAEEALPVFTHDAMYGDGMEPGSPSAGSRLDMDSGGSGGRPPKQRRVGDGGEAADGIDAQTQGTPVADEADPTGEEVVDETRTALAEYLSERDFDLVTETAVLYSSADEREKRVAAIYIRGALDVTQCRKAARGLSAAATRHNLRAATNGGEPPETGIVGYYDYLNNANTRKCRETQFTRQNWDTVADSSAPLLRAIDQVYRDWAPTQYNLQRVAIPNQYQLFDTVFSTITVNRNFRTAVHTDKGDFRSGLGVVAVIDGEFDGCHLAIKKLRKAFRLQVGDVLLFDTSLEHGNTEVRPPLRHMFGTPRGAYALGDGGLPWSRLSLVCYLRCGLMSQVCEMERRRQLNYTIAKQLQNSQQWMDTIDVNATDPRMPHMFLPRQALRILSPMQQAAISFALERLNKGSGCVIAMTMGLGKTLIALCLCYSHLYERPDGDVLILAPKAIISHWITEREKWKESGLCLPKFIASDGIDIPSFETALHQYNQQTRGEKLKEPHVFVINPEYLRSFTRRCRRFTPSMIIVDEGHRVASKGTKLKDDLEALRCPARVVLSGTPLQNDAEELYRLVDWINCDVHAAFPPRTFSDLAVSIKRYVEGDDTAFDAAVSAQRFIQEWMSGYVFRVMETGMPPLFDFLIICNLSGVQKRLCEIHSLSAVQNGALNATDHRLYHLSTHPHCFLAFITGTYKSLSGSSTADEAENTPHVLSDEEAALCTMASELLGEKRLEAFFALSGKILALTCIVRAVKARNEKLIVFSQYVGSQDFVSRTLSALEITSFTIRGRDAHDRRRTAMEEFRTNPELTALVLSTRIAAFGLDFTAANHVILFDCWWNPQVDAQAIARAYRRNQTKPVTVYRLASEHEDSTVIKVQMRKLALFDCIMNEQTSRAARSEEIMDCTSTETDPHRRQLWHQLKTSLLEGEGVPAVSKVYRYRDSVRLSEEYSPDPATVKEE